MLQKLPMLFLSLLILFITFNAEAQRGCCSHHGGVSRCDRDRGVEVCSDGTDSPTCGC